MGQLFKDLCVGPVVVIDDEVNKNDTEIAKLVKAIEAESIPVLKYESLTEVSPFVDQLKFVNFIVVDWVFGPEAGTGVMTGAAAETATKEEVLELIKRLKANSLSPIFVISAYDSEGIRKDLIDAGLQGIGKESVFVERKANLIAEEGKALINQVEKWISGHPHVYLSKWWTKAWLESNANVFWDLFDADPLWPYDFYKRFEDDGDDPTISLIAAISDLVHSRISMTSIVDDNFARKDYQVELSTQKKLYQLLVYNTRKQEIDKDIRPGDIFKDNDKYYLNVRPACDTTKRAREPIKVYLIEGVSRDPKNAKFAVDRGYPSPIEKTPELYLYNLDGNEFVVFDKRTLEVRDYTTDFAAKKVSRLTDEFMTRCTQSFASFIGRVGVPSYPHGVDFPKKEEQPKKATQVSVADGKKEG